MHKDMRKQRKAVEFLRYTICTLSLLALSSATFAETAPGVTAVRQAQQQVEQEQRREDERNRPQSALPFRQPSISVTPVSDPDIEKGGPCFTIKATLFEDQTGLLPIPPAYDVLNDSCADKQMLVKLVSDLNRYYQNQGYITTRVYLKPQNIGSGQLALVAKAGQLEALQYADGRDVDGRFETAFPLRKGEVITLQNLEQGLDNFNRPASQSGTTKLYPGSSAGQSVLVMTPQFNKPWRLETGYNNHGYDSTGLHKGSIGYHHDNLFALNETFSLSYNGNLNDDGDSKRSEGLSFTYSQPYKNWLFEFSQNHYRYQRILSAINQNYEIDGFSRSLNFNLERLLHRNQQSRVYLTSGLARKHSENYIEGLRIPAQSRELSLFNLGLRGDYGFANQALLEWSLTATAKIAAFGSQDVIPGLADDDFSYLRGVMKLQVPIAQQTFIYNGELAYQYSDDELTGSEQFSAGGVSSVRGFHQDSIYGNSGFYLRNQINPKAVGEGDWRFNYGIALDFGLVKSPQSINWSQQHVAGTALLLGLRYRKNIDIDLLLARALTRPEELQGDKNQALIQIKYRF